MDSPVALALLTAVVLLVGLVTGLLVARRRDPGSTGPSASGELSPERLLDLAEARMRATAAEARGDLDARRAAVDELVAPLRDALARVEAQGRALETAREHAYAGLTEQVRTVAETSGLLRDETAALVTALRRPDARGRWGEMTLRRVVELAGMSEHVDFRTQVSTSTGEGAVRPDLVVTLPGDKRVVVDSKVPLEAYLGVLDAADEAARRNGLVAHARQLRQHVDALARKDYGTLVEGSPEFVVLFVPGESLLAAALEADPALLDHAAGRSVLLASPTTLIALLRSVAYGWREERLAVNAREVCDTGAELYRRLSTLGGHLDRLGRGLDGAVKTYNEAVGSIESRVLVTARRLSTLGISDAELASPRPVETRLRGLSAPELAAGDDQAWPLAAAR